MERKDKIKKLKDISERLTALALVGVIGVTVSSCSKNKSNVVDDIIAVNEETSSVYGYGRESSRDERLIDYAFLHKLYDNASRSVVASQHYVYDRIIDWGTILNDDSILNKTLVAKISSKKFVNKAEFNDGKEFKSPNWFKKYDEMINIPESYQIDDNEEFLNNFDKNVVLDVYKGTADEYIVITNVIYVCKKDFFKEEDIKKDDVIRLTSIDEMYYDAKKSNITTIPIAKKQFGLKEEDKNVISNNYGNIAGFREIEQRDIDSFDNNLNQKFILKK